MPVFNPADRMLHIPATCTFTAATEPTLFVEGASDIIIDEVVPQSWMLFNIAWDLPGSAVTEVLIDFPQANLDLAILGWYCEPYRPILGVGLCSAGASVFIDDAGGWTDGTAELEKYETAPGVYAYRIRCTASAASDLHWLRVEMGYQIIPS